jgi:hypothetical protein
MNAKNMMANVRDQILHVNYSNCKSKEITGISHSPPSKVSLSPVFMQHITAGIKQSKSGRGIKHLTHNSRTKSVVETHKALLADNSHDRGVFALHTGQVHSDCKIDEAELELVG